jgi:hypothetical protein
MTPPRERWWLYGCRPDESNVDLMVMEIVGGTAKAVARSIHDAADAETWDRLSVQVAEIRARGQIVVCDAGDD